jgi:hypothetical protein
MNRNELQRAWRVILLDEKALKQRVAKFIEDAGFSSRAELVRKLQRSKIARDNRKRYAWRKAHGLCVACGEPARDVGVHCMLHARINADVQQGVRDRKKEKA